MRVCVCVYARHTFYHTLSHSISPVFPSLPCHSSKTINQFSVMGRFIGNCFSHTEMCHTEHCVFTQHTRIYMPFKWNQYLFKMQMNLKGFCFLFRACFGFLFTFLHCSMNKGESMVIASLGAYKQESTFRVFIEHSSSNFDNALAIQYILGGKPRNAKFQMVKCINSLKKQQKNSLVL